MAYLGREGIPGRENSICKAMQRVRGVLDIASRFVHSSFNKSLLSTYYILGTILGSRYTAVNKT